MFKKLSLFLIPKVRQIEPEEFRQYKLVVNIILITFLFDLDYGITTLLIHMSEGTDALIFGAVVNVLLVFMVYKNVPLSLIINIYMFINVMAVVVSVYFSGGFASPVTPWLATSPVVAMLMGGRRTGFLWLGINTIIGLYFGICDKYHILFPVHYDLSWKNNLAVNCLVGLILIVFFTSLVFEAGKNTALKKLAESSMLLAEEKRKNALHEISQEIHDGVGQTLSVIKLNLHLLEQRSVDKSDERMQETLSLVGKAITDLRNISNNLYTENIQVFDLEHALLDDLQDIKRAGAYETQLEIKGSPIQLEPRTALILHRIAKEAMNNILKHANATSITITLDYSSGFKMQIEDNGLGMKLSNAGSGQGMNGMRDRMKLLGGSLLVDSYPGKGTHLTAVL